MSAPVLSRRLEADLALLARTDPTAARLLRRAWQTAMSTPRPPAAARPAPRGANVTEQMQQKALDYWAARREQ